MEVLESFEVKLLFNIEVDTETGEIITKCVKKSIDKAVSVSDAKPKKKVSKKQESTDPLLTLEDNKYTLTQAAADLMGVVAGDKLDIKYEKQGKTLVPIIAKDDDFGTYNGNKVTKGLTVACRGSKNVELSKFGNEFLIIPHESKVGIFILQNKNAEVEKIVDDTTEEEIEFPVDDDIQNLIDEGDIKEIPSSLFQL